MTDELPEKVKILSADSRGRVNLGPEHANERVRVAVIEVVEDEDKDESND